MSRPSGRYCHPAGTAEKSLATATLKLRLAAIAYLHYLAGLPSPTTTAVVTETYAGLDRVAGDRPRPKLATQIPLLREILTPIGEDLPSLRDRALLLVGFTGAFRRSELARIRGPPGGMRALVTDHPARFQGRPGAQRGADRHPL
jgi:hypothetical protein